MCDNLKNPNHFQGVPPQDLSYSTYSNPLLLHCLTASLLLMPVIPILSRQLHFIVASYQYS